MGEGGYVKQISQSVGIEIDCTSAQRHREREREIRKRD